jgi:hypothetical protein
MVRCQLAFALTASCGDGAAGAGLATADGAANNTTHSAAISAADDVHTNA